MQRIIQETDLLPLKKDIVKINGFKKFSDLSLDYIDFLEKEKIPFSFMQYNSDTAKLFHSDSKKEFIHYVSSKKFGYFSFKNKEEAHIMAQFYLDSFIGKPFNDIEKIFKSVDFSQNICDFYRSLGLIALNTFDNELLYILTKDFDRKDKAYNIGMCLHSGNLPYLLKHHDVLFAHQDCHNLWKQWLIKINHYENYSSYNNNNTHTNNSTNTSTNVHTLINTALGRKARSFTLKLAGMIIFKQDKSMIAQLFTDYEDILSQRIVFDFFKENKAPEIMYSYHTYKNYIQDYQQSFVELEEVDLLQKKLTVDIQSIMQKNLLNYDKTSNLIQSIFNFFQQQADFKHSMLSFDTINKKCSFSLTATDMHFLNNGKQFLSTVFNDKDLFMNPEKYTSLFFYIHLNQKLEVKNIPSLKNKI